MSEYVKSFSSIADNITEEEYRNDGKMHYSTLAKYDREGFKGLSTLFDRVDTPSLQLGSVVDTLLTGGMEEFNDLYVVAEFPEISDVIISAVKGLFNVYKDEYNSLNDIPDEVILATLDSLNYGKTWRAETRLHKVRVPGEEYYRLLYLSLDKKLISNEMYAEACKMVTAVKTSPATSFLFAPNNPYDNSIERFYQLKFHTEHNNIQYSCMADLIIVFYDKKLVIPCDLKTSSHFEYEFPKSFIDWRYAHQARSYWRAIRDTMDRDEYFKDFELANYHFIVVNKQTLNPLVWEFKDTKTTGTLTYGKNNQIMIRDPYELGEELNFYLQHPASVPQGIDLKKPNDIIEWLNKEA